MYDENGNKTAPPGDEAGYPHINHAFLWRAGVMHDLGVLPGGRNSCAKCINNSDVIVGWADDAHEKQHAVFWRGGKLRRLRAPAGWESVANAINDRGEIVGHLSDRNHNDYACAWRIRGGSHAPRRVAPNASLQAVNNRGAAVGATEAARGAALVWDGRSVRRLRPPSPRPWAGDAEASNASGTVLGSLGTQPPRGGFVGRSVLWLRNGAAYELNDLLITAPGAPWIVTDAGGINDSGEIAAVAVRGEWEHAVILKPVH